MDEINQKEWTDLSEYSGLAPLAGHELRNLLEIPEERHGKKSTLIVSQLSIEHWHYSLGDATLADVIVDLRVHNAHKITLLRRLIAQEPDEILNLH